MRRMSREEGRSNVCGGEGAGKRTEGTNLSTQFSSFLSLHSIRTEPPNTPCEKSINQSSHSTSCQRAAHTHILDVCWAPSSQSPPPPDSYLPSPELTHISWMCAGHHPHSHHHHQILTSHHQKVSSVFS